MSPRITERMHQDHLAWIQRRQKLEPLDDVTRDAHRIVQTGLPYRTARSLGIEADGQRVIILGADRGHVIVENGDLHIIDSKRLNLAVRWTVANEHDRKEQTKCLTTDRRTSESTAW